MKDYKYIINGKEVKVTIGDIEGNIANVEVNGEAYKVEMEKKEEAPKPKVVVKKPAAQAPAAKTETAAVSKGKASVKAPLPGTVIEITVNVGDTVKKGDTVLVLEAMKMANNISADKDGKVTAICVQPGDSVMSGDDLIAID